MLRIFLILEWLFTGIMIYDSISNYAISVNLGYFTGLSTDIWYCLLWQIHSLSYLYNTLLLICLMTILYPLFIMILVLYIAVNMIVPCHLNVCKLTHKQNYNQNQEVLLRWMIKYHRTFFDKRPNDVEFDHKRMSNIQCIVLTITSYACVY